MRQVNVNSMIPSHVIPKVETEDDELVIYWTGDAFILRQRNNVINVGHDQLNFFIQHLNDMEEWLSNEADLRISERRRREQE